MRTNTVAFGLIETRLTASKASGETIEVGGQEIALGLCGLPSGGKAGPPGPSSIHLQRESSADEAADAVLL